MNFLYYICCCCDVNHALYEEEIDKKYARNINRTKYLKKKNYTTII